MIKYDPQKKIVVMDLVDLEHCGFDHSEFDAELALAGIDDLAAQWPIALLVDFSGGAVRSADTRAEALAVMDQAHRAFEALCQRLGVEPGLTEQQLRLSKN